MSPNLTPPRLFAEPVSRGLPCPRLIWASAYPPVSSLLYDACGFRDHFLVLWFLRQRISRPCLHSILGLRQSQSYSVSGPRRVRLSRPFFLFMRFRLRISRRGLRFFLGSTLTLLHRLIAKHVGPCTFHPSIFRLGLFLIQVSVILLSFSLPSTTRPSVSTYFLTRAVSLADFSPAPPSRFGLSILALPPRRLRYFARAFSFVRAFIPFLELCQSSIPVAIPLWPCARVGHDTSLELFCLSAPPFLFRSLRFLTLFAIPFAIPVPLPGPFATRATYSLVSTMRRALCTSGSMFHQHRPRLKLILMSLTVFTSRA